MDDEKRDERSKRADELLDRASKMLDGSKNLNEREKTYGEKDSEMHALRVKDAELRIQDLEAVLARKKDLTLKEDVLWGVQVEERRAAISHHATGSEACIAMRDYYLEEANGARAGLLRAQIQFWVDANKLLGTVANVLKRFEK